MKFDGTIRVDVGPAALRVGRYWVGVASGDRYARRKRRTIEAALRDARKLEQKSATELGG